MRRGWTLFGSALALWGALTVPAVAAGLAPRMEEARKLMRQERWEGAAALLTRQLEEKPLDATAHLLLGRTLLAKGDLPLADRHLTDAGNLDHALRPEVAKVWAEEGKRALATGNLERAGATYAKAVALTPTLGPHLGRELLAATREEADPLRRARVVQRLMDWVGDQTILTASVEYYKRQWGPARTVDLSLPGWAELPRLQAGDKVHYLAEHALRQRDNATIRILPAAVVAPVTLTIEPRDMAGKADTLFTLAQHQIPTRVYLWIIPKTH